MEALTSIIQEVPQYLLLITSLPECPIPEGSPFIIQQLLLYTHLLIISLPECPSLGSSIISIEEVLLYPLLLITSSPESPSRGGSDF